MRYMRYLLSEILLTLCCYYAVNDEFIEVDLDNSWGVVMEMEMSFGQRMAFALMYIIDTLGQDLNIVCIVEGLILLLFWKMHNCYYR